MIETKRDTTPAAKPAEQLRLEANAAKAVPLEMWGPYLSERQWGTVREDYSRNGDAWHYFSHDQARSRAYRWGEDGLGGLADYMQNICFAVALWNGNDPILKERLFGLANGEGNHGEDVKELYYYLDNVPTHYYMKYLYKYPHAAYPYLELIEKNKARTRQEPEYEILDTGVFDGGHYFDVFIEYAKKTSTDIFIKIEIKNRSINAAPITVLPTLWFYNRWQYGGMKNLPAITQLTPQSVSVTHERLDDYWLYFEEADALFFTENETNNEKLFNSPNKTEVVKDAFHEAIIENKNGAALRQRKQGTKFSPVYNWTLEGGASKLVYLRLTNHPVAVPFDASVPALFEKRKAEADAFYEYTFSTTHTPEQALLKRQAMAGLLWSKQYYHFDVESWLVGDAPLFAPPERLQGRNSKWLHLKNQDVISMPDKWEYPWYAAWDAAFHAISMALVDPVFAKNQLLVLMREWYMNPEGELPAYEWNFSDLNPPVHAFAALEVYHIEKARSGKADVEFLKKVFQKLIINFTWWVNRKDINGNNVFEGGFLGLDNIGIFNRNIRLPDETFLEQTDGTSWMGMYALNLMDMALEVATHDRSFEDAATKFYEHFVIIAAALNELGLWNETDRFFYDVLSLNGTNLIPLQVRSIVGLIPLFAVSVVTKEEVKNSDDFKKRMHWFKEYRLQKGKYLPSEEKSGADAILLSLIHKERLQQLLQRFLDEAEFLSPGGIRSLSKYHLQHPYSITIGCQTYGIAYDPADSTSDAFGGNSNWRGPVWMPINFLFIKALQKYGEFYGDSFKVECPRGSGRLLNLQDVAAELIRRLQSVFMKDEKGNRPLHGAYNWFYQRDENKDLLLFYEYFHGDTARGLGASHQTGWTALIANLI